MAHTAPHHNSECMLLHPSMADMLLHRSMAGTLPHRNTAYTGRPPSTRVIPLPCHITQWPHLPSPAPQSHTQIPPPCQPPPTRQLGPPHRLSLLCRAIHPMLLWAA